MNRKGEAGKYLRLISMREVATIATIVDLVTEVIQPAIRNHLNWSMLNMAKWVVTTS